MRPAFATLAAALALVVAGRAADPEPLVDVARACPGIQVELRYATAKNLTGKPIYPPGARALVLPGVADRLNRAHRTLQARGFGLKIWDAYRPVEVQRILWNTVRNRAFVVEPGGIGSLHSWGAAVDVTLVDFGGNEVRMPTDFDDFTPAASYYYRGPEAEIARNLKTLQFAMAEAGFRHIRDEWWHYSVADQLRGKPPEVPLAAPESSELAQGVEPAAPGLPPAENKPAPPKTAPRPTPGGTPKSPL